MSKIFDTGEKMSFDDLKPGDTIRLINTNNINVITVRTSDGTVVKFVLDRNHKASFTVGNAGCDIRMDEFISMEEAFPD